MSTTMARLFDEAKRVIPGGVNSPVRAWQAVGLTPRIITYGSGARVFDVDGNSYLDYVGSWGPLILGHAEPAEAAFRHALHQQAGAAVVWNNLAYALAARQCIGQAREAARCATRIGPENTEFAHTLEEMEGLPGSGAGTCPPLPACPAH